MPRRSRKTHFPRANGTRTLCGAYVTENGYWTYIKATAHFNNVTCRECRQHPTFADALCAFEIGEYSWEAWLKQYEKPVEVKPCPPPMSQSNYDALLAQQKKDAADRIAMRERFEARSKKR